jgi:cytochrome c553
MNELERADINRLVAKHSFKVLLCLLLFLVVTCVALMSPYWRGQIVKYNCCREVPTSLTQAPTPQLIEHGKALFGVYCAGCHGVEGVGQDPDIPMGGYFHTARFPEGFHFAPALDMTGHAMIHATSSLFFVVKYGSLVRKDSAMVGWQGRLTDDDMVAIVQFIRSTWSEPARQAQGRFINHWLP